MPLNKEKAFILRTIVVVRIGEHGRIFVRRKVLPEPCLPITRAFRRQIIFDRRLIFLDLRLQFLILFFQAADPLASVTTGHREKQPCHYQMLYGKLDSTSLP